MRFPPIFSLIFLFLTVLFFVYFALPNFNEWQTLKVKVEKEKALLEEKRKLFEGIEKLLSQVEKEKEIFSKLQNALPPFSDLFDFLAFLQDEISKNGLSLSKIEILGQIPVKEKLTKNSLSLLLTGSYSSFKNFLLDLELSERMIEIEEVEILSQGQENLNFALKLSIYFYQL